MSDESLTTQPEPTLREQLAANLAEANESAPLAESPPLPEKTDSEPVGAETTEQKAGRLANRLRDETGKLLPGKATAQPEPIPSSPPLEAPVVAAPKRPSTWKKETWPVYDKLASGQPLTPEEAKMVVDTVHQREADFAKGVSTYKQEWDSARPLLEAIAPYQADMQQYNINPADMVGRLMAAHKQLSLGTPQDKLSMFQRLCADYQIPAQLAVQDQQGNWNLLGQQPQPQQQQPQFQPQDVQRLVRQELESERTLQTVAEFERNAPEHYELVKQDMAGLLQAGLAQDLPSAYEAALRLPKHADIFESLQQQQRDKVEAEQKALKAQKVTRARANAVSTSTATPSGNMAQVGDKSLRDQLTENMREVIGGRV